MCHHGRRVGILLEYHLPPAIQCHPLRHLLDPLRRGLAVIQDQLCPQVSRLDSQVDLQDQADTHNLRPQVSPLVIRVRAQITQSQLLLHSAPPRLQHNHRGLQADTRT